MSHMRVLSHESYITHLGESCGTRSFCVTGDVMERAVSECEGMGCVTHKNDS